MSGLVQTGWTDVVVFYHVLSAEHVHLSLCSDDMGRAGERLGGGRDRAVLPHSADELRPDPLRQAECLGPSHLPPVLLRRLHSSAWTKMGSIAGRSSAAPWTTSRPPVTSIN